LIIHPTSCRCSGAHLGCNGVEALGAGVVAAAMDQAFPIIRAQDAMAQAVSQPAASHAVAAPEKRDLKIGFIGITCATPIIMAAPMGFYARNGLNVEVVRTAGWAVIRDKSLNGEYDASHMLSPVPLAISTGAGSNPIPWSGATVENINGQAITLANKHKDRRDPKDWKGFKLGIPFDYSMHAYLLRYYLAEAGLDPDRDVQLRAVPPPEMVTNLRAENVDGFLGLDPFNQRAVYDGVGFIHLLTRELWDGHPCCALAVPQPAPRSTQSMPS
jgi:nitrate/nitrite transport system substrate-binding protein